VELGAEEGIATGIESSVASTAAPADLSATAAPADLASTATHADVSTTATPAAEGRVFTSTDPLVGDLATKIDAAYPGHVVGVNVPITDATGRVVTDADILLRNAIIQVKSGPGKGLTTQLLNTQAATNLPVIGYGPQLGGSLVRGIQAAGGLVTQDEQLLIDVVAP
jgi:hypothetical protein